MAAHKTSYILLLLFIFISCASKQTILKEDQEKIQQAKILFLNYSIKKLANGEKKIALINQITADGKLKGKPNTIKNTKTGDLEYSILDKNHLVIEKHTMDNPLEKIVEYVNDLGNFEKRVIELDSVQFSIRIQLNSKAKRIIISEFTKNGTKKLITTKIE